MVVLLGFMGAAAVTWNDWFDGDGLVGYAVARLTTPYVVFVGFR
jgi:hypothetical protein